VTYLFLILWDLPWVFDDLDFGVERKVRGAREARERLEASLHGFDGALEGLAGQDARTVAEAVGDSLPWLAEQEGVGLHDLARQVSDAAAQARHLVFREADDRSYLADPAYPAASVW